MTTRKHFEAVAKILRERRQLAEEEQSLERIEEIDAIAEDLITLFYEENPRFSREKFTNAVRRPNKTKIKF